MGREEGEDSTQASARGKEASQEQKVKARIIVFFYTLPVFFRVFLHIRNIFIMLIKQRDNTLAFLRMEGVVTSVSVESDGFINLCCFS